MSQKFALPSARDRLILAIDTSTLEEARRLIDELYEFVGVLKVGLEMLMNEGPQVLELFQERGSRVFLDGKFLDIPNTVAKATEAVARAGVDMFTVHATGGSKMLTAAVGAANRQAQVSGRKPPVVLAVTVLTSLDQPSLNNELRVPGDVADQVVHLAKLAQASGITGLVASPSEVKQIRQSVGPDMVLVTPGIRPRWAEANDQSRIMTPADAIACGADYLVIGRPITAAPDRKDAARRIVEEMEIACSALS